MMMAAHAVDTVTGIPFNFAQRAEWMFHWVE